MNQPLPSQGIKLRILRSVESVPVPSRAAESLRAVTLNAGAIAIAIGLFWLQGGVRVTGRSPALIH